MKELAETIPDINKDNWYKCPNSHFFASILINKLIDRRSRRGN
jgi:hypothetical protein